MATDERPDAHGGAQPITRYPIRLNVGRPRFAGAAFGQRSKRVKKSSIDR